MREQSAGERARSLGLERALRWYEKGLTWVLLGLLASLLAFGLVVVVLQGHLIGLGADSFAPVLRGYTSPGTWLGWFAAVLALVTFAYSLRKRWLQERLRIFRASMVAWLWVHVVAGLVCLLAALLHAGFGVLDYRPTTGKFLFWLLVLVSISGVLWRLVYRFVPPSVAATIGNYSEKGSTERAELQALEIEKAAAGGSQALHQWKDWLLAAARTDAELEQAKAQFSATQEAVLFARMCELAASRYRALKRATAQRSATTKLQWWRIVHAPISLLFVVGLPLHIIEVYDVPVKVLPPEARLAIADSPLLSGVHDPAACGDCHRTIYDQWQHSMHAVALITPMMIAQNNQVMLRELNTAGTPDPKRICVNCHAPSATELAQAEMLPFGPEPAVNHGITCTVCHQMTGPSTSGGGAYTNGAIASLEPGRVMHGPFAGAVGNTYHQSQFNPAMTADASLICQNCHDVNMDRNKSGKIELGHDLVLQSTYQEYMEYRKAGGAYSCTACHMPAMRGMTRAAESAAIPDQQDVAAPPREVHDHSFVGVDYPLEHPGTADPHRPTRQALLRSAAKFNVTAPTFDAASRTGRVTVSLTNVGAGHNLPSGFAFARQMWVELLVTDKTGKQLVFESGVLRKNTDDLCDRATFDDAQSPIRAQMQGCTASDPQLVNFQRKLVDKADILKDGSGQPVVNERGELTPVAAVGASETSIQRVAGNPVARKRPIDGQPMISLPPGQTRSFGYAFKVPAGMNGVNIRARLMFRNLPAYFLRDLAKNQPPNEKPQLAPLIQNLDLIEMGSASVQLATE